MAVLLATTGQLAPLRGVKTPLVESAGKQKQRSPFVEQGQVAPMSGIAWFNIMKERSTKRVARVHTCVTDRGKRQLRRDERADG